MIAGSPGHRARLVRVLVLAILVVVLVFGVRYARATDWQAVAAALRSYRPARLAACLGMVLLSYLLYCAYELVARRQVGHRLPRGRTAAIAFVCYAVALNLGALLGSGGMRLRLYSRAGLSAGRVARIAGFTVLTNWLGYAALTGVVLLVAPLPLPPGAGEGIAWRLPGAVMLLMVLAYLALCARHGGRHLHLRGQAFVVPSLRMALLQLLLSCLNWAVLGALLFLLLPAGVAYPRVLAIVLVSAVAGVLLHTPAGLGAWETMFLLTLGAQLGEPAVLAALLAFRGLYYLLPLGVAGLVYLWLESRRVRLPGSDAAG
ncbi:MAG: UPF0104 family protein [Pseudoxanthomonas sp.]|nr:UPF0104 family protein [Pseudoxanthomonas sp.]